MSKKQPNHIKRLISDIIDLKKDPVKGIFIKTDEKNITEIKAIIIGPEETPYFGGYYTFKLNFSKKYPFEPPKGLFCTTNGSIRFNPNLYSNGYICLSILGTWSGPSWCAIQTMKSVLLSICSLLNEYPLRNEPGYEDFPESNQKIIDYNKCVEYHNFSYAILHMLKNPDEFRCFHKIMIDEFIKNYDKHMNKLVELESKNQGDSILCPLYNKTSIKKMDYTNIINEFKKIKKKIDSNESILELKTHNKTKGVVI